MRLRRRRHGFHSAKPARRGRFRGDRRRHPWLRRTLIVVGIVVVLAVAAGGAGWFYLGYRLDHVPRLALTAGVLTPQAGGAPYDVLLLESSGGGGPVGVAALARVDPHARTVELMAIPASLRVPPAKARIGTAPVPLFGSISPATTAGLSQLVHNVAALLHVPVAHVAEVDTAGVQGLVDRLGGVYLDFPAPLADQSTGLRLDSTGCQQVSGAEAATLAGSTSPYWYQHGQWQQWAGGDLTMVPVDMAVVAGLLERASPSLGNPFGLDDLVSAAGGAITVDSGWSAGGLMSDAGQLAGVPASSIRTATLPTAAAGAYRVTTPATSAAIAAFLAGSPPAAAASPPWMPQLCTP